MISEILLMAVTVWYVPGWMRTQEPQEGVMPAMSNAFPKAEKSVQGVGWQVRNDRRVREGQTAN